MTACGRAHISVVAGIVVDGRRGTTYPQIPTDYHTINYRTIFAP
jgi:hypothetical protein